MVYLPPYHKVTPPPLKDRKKKSFDHSAADLLRSLANIAIIIGITYKG